MNSNIRNDSPFLSNNRDNSSSIPDVLEQIKKRSEEISTSEASSIKFLQNLSNPTNLTNPQIITSLNHNSSLFQKNRKLPSLKKNRLIFSNDNTKKMPIKSKSETMLSNLSPISTIDPFNLDNYHNLIEKAELEILSDKKSHKPKKKIILEKIDRNLISEREYLFSRNFRNIFPENKSVMNEEGNIWEKIKNTNLVPINKAKDKRTNFRSFISKKDYVEKTNLIKLFLYNNKNRNERYYNYISMKNSQMKSTNDTIDKLQKSRDFLDKKYNDEFVSYIQFLGKEIEKEKKQKIILMNEKNKLLFEVNKLQNKINKIKNIKYDLIKWLYLQIQVKENLKYLPEYYKNIIEDNFSLNEINKRGKGKYNLKLDEYLRILEYRGKNIYDNVNEFCKKLEDLEIRSLTILNSKFDLLEENIILKKEYNEIQSKYLLLLKEDNDKFKQLNNELRKAKKTNIELENKIIQIKTIKKSSKSKYFNKALANKLVTFENLHSNIIGKNLILKNNKNMLYYFTLCLYYIVSINNFEELKYNNLKIDLLKEDDKMILEILDYGEKALNLLLAQKKYYFSKEKLKKIYEKCKEETDKNTKIEKIMIQIKLRKAQEIEKREKLNEKINKQYYKPKRKIDYDYYRKEMNKKIQTIMNKSAKNETKFEDFFYDIDS